MYRFPSSMRPAPPGALPAATSSPTTTPRSPKRPSPMAAPDAPSNLTPHRKHHKLLKDGSEVWSKEVELVFVDGLRKYWQSPWATYSRGRSRWRNQFLVDHLSKHGITRSKKQVASHIQVLRNMWRGEPEFHLVAGGEELFQENGLLADSPNASTASPEPPTPDTADATSAHSASPASTPDWTDFEFPLDFGAPPASAPAALPFSDAYFDAPAPAPASAPPAPAPVKLEPLALDPALFSLPHASPETFDFAFRAPNRVASLSLWADGMPPASIDAARLAGPAPARVLLRVHLRAAAGCAPGWHGALAFTRPWAAGACHTKTWAAGACVAHEVGALDALVPEPAAGPSSAPPQPVVAYLPASALSRCRHTDPVQGITQQIVVDGEVLAVVIYTLDRAQGAAPAAELVGFQKYPWQVPPGPPRMPFAAPPTPVSPAAPPAPSYSPPVSPSALVYAVHPGYAAQPQEGALPLAQAGAHAHAPHAPLSCAAMFDRAYGPPHFDAHPSGLF